MIEALDFKAGRLQAYAYTTSVDGQKFGWFDPASPSNDAALAETFPHHYHDLSNGAGRRRALHSRLSTYPSGWRTVKSWLKAGGLPPAHPGNRCLYSGYGRPRP
jgi:hypothetical protein